MALPNLTSNSPSAGSIAWTAFGIAFDGVSYPISAGNTANKFVWWEYATKTIKSNNTLPALVDEDMLLFINKGGVGALVPMTDVLDGSLIVPQSIFANAIAADQITADHIAAQAVEAEHISAGAITTEKLTVGSVGDNLVMNGSFEEFGGGVPLGWMSSVEAGTGSCDVVSGVSSSGAYAARLIVPNATSGARLSQVDDKVIPVSSASGRSWYVSARVGASVAITKGFSLQVRWLTATKSLHSTATAVNNVAVGTSWTVLEGRVTPPSAARYMRVTVVCTLPNVATNVYVDEVTAREVVVGAVIADDAITATHIIAGAIDFTTIRGATVIGGEIKTSDTTAVVNARMGPTSVWDPIGGTTAPGIGFTKIGTNDANPAGMYSKDGHTLMLTQSYSGGAGGATIMLGDDASTIGSAQKIGIKSWGETRVTARGGIVLDGSTGSAASSVTVVGTLNGIDLDPAVATQVTWSNGWTNFGGGYGNLQVKEIMPGVVLMQGMAKPGTKSGGIAICTLPVGFRPNRIQNVPCVVRTSLASPDANSPGMLQINTTGVVQLHCDAMPSAAYALISSTFFLNSP